MTGFLLLGPLLLRFATAIALMFAWRQIVWQRYISLVGEALAVTASAVLLWQVQTKGTLVMQAGNWAAPYGISFVVDSFSAMLLLVASMVGLGVSLFAAGSMLNNRLRFGFYPIYHFLLAGISGAFLAGDIFNLYVWFEVMIISSFVLLTLGGERSQIEGAVKYFTLNFLASIIFLTALAMLYGLTGTLNMADLSLRLAQVEQRSLVDICAFILFVAFGIKSAVFPLYFWLPASYHTPPVAVTAIFGGLLTKVGVYAIIRVFTLLFPWDAFIEQMLGAVAVLTILSGGLGALVQKHVVKSVSWLIICHIGFMLAAVATHNQQALAGALFYMVHDMVAKTGVFLATGIMYRLVASHLYSKMGGVMQKHPGWSVLLVIPLFSLVGIPPLSGFWPKLSMLIGMATAEKWWFFGAVLVGSFITLVVVMRLWIEVFWKPASQEEVVGFRYFKQYPTAKQGAMLLGMLVMVGCSLLIVYGAPQLQSWSLQAAEDLLSPQVYLEQVLKIGKEIEP
ncbi:MAG: Na+/H+ antiporter subunit D [Sphingobacteriaceae bacterium]|nr:Na+/H+ antiporter subunit D [Sphingobacteriaceae bacterium]